MAGVTPRTLHYYDQIGLLNPTLVGENGYRYYGQEALLRLQQVLLYRQLDMPLALIQEIMAGSDFDVQSALQSHKQQLHRRIEQLERLIQTVDHTMLYLKGKMEMSGKQLFEAFGEDNRRNTRRKPCRCTTRRS
jgi:DNA-binding transcriptional MerR regulator